MDYIIIVAGGKGLRMGGEIPKQFLPIDGKPILMRTLERFHTYSETLRIILVLPKDQQAYWLQLCEEYHFPLPQQEGEWGESYQMTDGGETRFHSVQHGLALIPDDAEGVVGVHDGVRPFPVLRSSATVMRRHGRQRLSSPSSPSSRPSASYAVSTLNSQLSTLYCQKPSPAMTTDWYRPPSVSTSNC